MFANYGQPIFVSILLGLLIFPLLWIPYFLVNRKKDRLTNRKRKFLYMLFVFYILTAYGLVILPLPDIVDNFCDLYYSPPQLYPFNFVSEIIETSSTLRASGAGFIKSFIGDFASWQVIFNLLLLVPLGVFLRFYFKLSLAKTIAVSFFVSLSFELLQLSGLLGVYPCSYRLFDVDDLILNTAGAALGFYLTYFRKFFTRIEEKSDSRKSYFGRRIFALVIDIIIASILADLLKHVGRFDADPSSSFSGLIVAIVYFSILPRYMNMQTIGLKIMKLKIVASKNKVASLFLRAAPIYIVLLGGIVAHKFFDDDYSGLVEVLIIIFVTVLSSASVLFSKNAVGVHEKLSSTELKSTK